MKWESSRAAIVKCVSTPSPISSSCSLYQLKTSGLEGTVLSRFFPVPRCSSPLIHLLGYVPGSVKNTPASASACSQCPPCGFFLLALFLQCDLLLAPSHGLLVHCLTMSTLLVHCHDLLLHVHDVLVQDQGDLVVVVELVELLLQDVVDLLRDVVGLLRDVVGLLRDVVVLLHDVVILLHQGSLLHVMLRGVLGVEVLHLLLLCHHVLLHDFDQSV